MNRPINVSGKRMPKSNKCLRYWEKNRSFDEAILPINKEKILALTAYRRGVPTEEMQKELVLNNPGEKSDKQNMGLPDDLSRPKPPYSETIQPNTDSEYWFFAIRRGPRPKTLDEEENKARGQFTRRRNKQLGLLMSSFPEVITNTEQAINRYYETREKALALLPVFSQAFQDLFIRIELAGEYFSDIAEETQFVSELRRLQPHSFQDARHNSPLFIVKETYARICNDLTALLSSDSFVRRIAMYQKDQTILRNILPK